MLNEWGLFTSWAVLNVGTFFKHKGFRDEREYRIAYNLFCDPYDPTKCLSLFSDNDHNKPYSFDVYQKEGMMVPFVDVDISSDSFQAVTLSPRIAAEYYADGLKLKMFSGCDSLSEIKLPETVDSIGADAFRDCSSLQSIVIPESVHSIGENAFSGTHPKFTLLCHRLSEAEKYARSHDITFQIIY